jgi:lipid-binding SYLF domain-containing protein
MRGLAIAASLTLATAVWADTAKERLTEASEVFTEIMKTPDKGIPEDLLSKAECVIILPNVKKAAFVVGGEYGRGFAECRHTAGTGWGAPAAVKLEGGSVGFQIGGSSTDLILLVMNRKGLDKLMQDKFTLGADASIAAGPVGRTAAAQTDARLDAEILAWSRSKGLFAGISLKGAVLKPDDKENESLYGHTMTNKEILASSTMTAPAEARALVAELNRHAPGSSADRSREADRVKK